MKTTQKQIPFNLAYKANEDKRKVTYVQLRLKLFREKAQVQHPPPVSEPQSN